MWGGFSKDRDPKAHGVYLRGASFTLPEGWTSRTTRVVVNSVSNEGTIYVNGQKIGNVRGYARC